MQLHEYLGILTAFLGGLNIVFDKIIKPMFKAYSDMTKYIDQIEKNTQDITTLRARDRNKQQLSNIALMECDNKGQCVYVNPAFLKVTGLRYDDCLGEGWLSIITDLRERQRVRAEWSEASENNTTFNYTTTITNISTGEKMNVTLSGFFYRDGETLVLYTGTI